MLEKEITSNIKYLTLLSEQYPNIQSASTEMINLQAILNLPKGTEHFLSDLHGEYEPFLHILRNASGVIKDKIKDIFGNTLSSDERRALATLIYYPEQKLEMTKKNLANVDDWYKITLYRLIEICRVAGSKYTRSKVRKALPKDFEYIIDELLHTNDYSHDKEGYYAEIIKTIIKTERADAFIIALSRLIQRLSIDHLHILGDIFDRGPRPDIIMEALMAYHSVDIQWGNHDILWMGAAAGSDACIANVLNVSAKYNNFDALEDGYGINIRPLAIFALATYKDDPCTRFVPRNPNEVEEKPHDIALVAKMHKAISIIQFKLEGQIVQRHPEYKMQAKTMLDKVNYETGMLMIDGADYQLVDTNFPTINPASPFELTAEEAELVEKLRLSFLHSEKLQQHIRFLYTKGSMYTVYNSNLLYHGCIPMDEDGEFTNEEIFGEKLCGKNYIDYAEVIARQGYFAKSGTKEKKDGLDFLWYLWCGAKSPLYGKSKMATFERYFTNDKKIADEVKDSYYTHIENEATCIKVLAEFGLKPEDSHIINGHVPVKIRKGESPIKAGGKLLVIDGGLSKAYQPQTGIAGYTLIYNSYGLVLASHEPFESITRAIVDEEDLHSKSVVLERGTIRKKVADTDSGISILSQIHDLELLLMSYRKGILKEKTLM